MKQILYLPSWFPTRNNPYPGDFIRRHAESASLYNRIIVFYTAIDEKIKVPEIAIENAGNNLTIYTYYYPKHQGVLSSVVNGVKRFSALRKLYNSVFGVGAPDLVHVHVAYPAGLFALFLKKRKGLKYIISEHDGIYMPGYDDHHVPGSFEKKMVPVIYKNASCVHAVSNDLAKTLRGLKLAKETPVVIPNVVDSALFHARKKERGDKVVFVHVSSLINQKNPEGMLEALAMVKKHRNDFKLRIIGPKKEKILNLTRQLSLEHEVEFTGEIPYNAVAKEIGNADAMIHFTRYETFGCVVAESLSSGVPVIVSDLDVTRELVTDHVNGLLVKEADVRDLADKILYFMEGNFKINAEEVATKNQEKFNYKRVGKMFDEMYKLLA
jgi:glycosyltransferase involved in cell wall biosynthesis